MKKLGLLLAGVVLALVIVGFSFSTVLTTAWVLSRAGAPSSLPQQSYQSGQFQFKIYDQAQNGTEHDEDEPDVFGDPGEHM